MRIAIYARKSTESNDRQTQSLEDQLQILHALAKKERHQVVEVIAEAKSAKEPDSRPGFRRLLELVRSGEAQGILTWHPNRLTRNLIDGGVLAHLLSSGDLQMIRTPERIYRPEDNVILMAIENGVATSYIHDLRKAVKRGMDSKASKGWKPGKAPIGYLNNWETREIDIDPKRAPLVRKAWEMLLSRTHTVAEIARVMESLGLTRKGRKSGGKALGKTGFLQLFRNPFYSGRFLYKGELYEGKHEPLVSALEFDAAQAILENRSFAFHKSETPGIYSGLFRCADCGRAVVNVRKTKLLARGTIANYSYYHCAGGKGCSRKSVSEDRLTDDLVKFADVFGVSNSFADWCKEAIKDSGGTDQQTSRKGSETVKNELADAIKRKDTLTLAFLDGDVDKESFIRLKETLDKEIQTKRFRVRKLDGLESEIEAYIAGTLDAAVKAKLLVDGNTSYRRIVLASIGGRHVFRDGTLTLDADPILKKVVSLEPPPGSSQSVKSHDFFPDSPLWWALVDDIKKIARMQVELRERDAA